MHSRKIASFEEGTIQNPKSSTDRLEGIVEKLFLTTSNTHKGFVKLSKDVADLRKNSTTRKDRGIITEARVPREDDRKIQENRSAAIFIDTAVRQGNAFYQISLDFVLKKNRKFLKKEENGLFCCGGEK
uniref:Uncharacterized protein n=1 Tax=Glossina austeni TaxID=7395 RepID=A0A1A9VP67_GLOAU